MFGALAAIVGAGAITLAGGILAVTAGLLVVAAAIGWAVTVTLATGSDRAGTRTQRRWLAVVMTTAGIALGQLGLWLVARQEGGVLGLTEYLAEVFGILVPLQLAVGAVVAWWQAR